MNKMHGDVSSGNNTSLPKYTRKYSVQIREYANQSLSPPEFEVYRVLFDTIKEKHNLTEPEHLMLLDLVIFDFLRIKRLQKHIRTEGDMSERQAKSGIKYWKVNEASYLLNAVESQFRHNMKELMLTPKEITKKMFVTGEGDFAKWVTSKVIDVESKGIKDG